LYESRKEYKKEYRNRSEVKKKEKLYNNSDKTKERQKKWFNENKEHRLNYEKKYKMENKEKIKKINNRYYVKNKEKISTYRNGYFNNKYRTNTLFKLTTIIRSSINYILKNNGVNKSKKTQEILGCSFEEFKIYLESKFESWMNWNNQGLYNGELNYGWDIDHIIPASSAINEEELIKLNHYTNLQPLCSKINRDIKKDNI